MQRGFRGRFGKESRLLVGAVRELSLARTLQDVQAVVRRAARALTGADGATFVLRDGDACVYADEDAIAPLWKGRRFPLSECISGWVMLRRSSAVIEDVTADRRIPQDAYRPTFVKSLAMVPIRRTDPIGAIGIYWAKRHRPTAAEVELLEALADSTSVAMERVMPVRAARARATHGDVAVRRCQNLYAFLRLRLGREISDREIARRWGMSWRSFVNLKEGSRRVPRVEELEALAGLLGVDALVVFLVALGEPAEVVNRWLSGRAEEMRSALLSRVGLGAKQARGTPHSSVERMPWAVFTIDIKGRIQDFNSRCVSLLGTGVRSLVGANPSNFVAKESATALLRLQAQCLERGEAGPANLLLENGSKVAVSMVRIEGTDGKPIGLQCVAQAAGKRRR